jgi:thioredoxin reductase (NADPH)
MSEITEDPSTTPVDLLVVGAGPCGIAVAAATRKAGLSCLLVDRGPLCASLVRYPYDMRFFSTPEKLELERLPFVTTDKTPSRKEALTYYRKVAEHFELRTRLYEEVTAIDGVQGDFRVRTVRRLRVPGAPGDLGEGTPRGAPSPGSGVHAGESDPPDSLREGAGERVLKARNLVIATGGFHGPNLLEVPGEDLPKVTHHYTEAHPYWECDVVVVGGSNSAVESSLELFRAGARVTLVHFGKDFDRSVKPWVLPDIQNRVEAGEVTGRFRTRVARIEEDAVVLRSEVDGSEERIANDFVLALTGWKADPVLLEAVGVGVDPETGIPAHDPETMETEVPGVYIAGVLSAGHDANRIFIENGRWHGRLIAAHITGTKAEPPPGAVSSPLRAPRIPGVRRR